MHSFGEMLVLENPPLVPLLYSVDTPEFMALLILIPQKLCIFVGFGKEVENGIGFQLASFKPSYTRSRLEALKIFPTLNCHNSVLIDEG